MAGRNYAYLLRCADGTLYCGWTNDLEKRVVAHNAGTGAKYTKSRRPVELAYCEAFAAKNVCEFTLLLKVTVVTPV